MIEVDLTSLYRDYIDCLNQRNLSSLEQFVHDDVQYNGKLIGVSSYCELLRRNFHDIPDLFFHVELLITDAPYVASRLFFNCRPTGEFLGMHINGRNVSFHENVFYKLSGGKIVSVWSIIDVAAIEAQL